MLEPARRRTWALAGKGWVQKTWARRGRLSAISGITVSPVRRRLGLYFKIHRQNILWPQALEFITLVHRALQRKLILVLDRYNVHRKAVRVLLEKHPGWFEPEWLPAHAPELNPDEGVWRHGKYEDLGNFIPDDLDHLERELVVALEGQGKRQELLTSYFRRPRLDL